MSPSRPLRAELIAALKPYIDVDPAIEPNEWNLAQSYNAGLALDAFLDALETRADQIRNEAYERWTADPDPGAGDMLTDLIAVLREGDG